MSQTLETAVHLLNAKLGGGFAGLVRFVITGEGVILVDSSGARAAGGAEDGEADVTLTAETDVFQAILAGELDPTSAYMSGRLAIEGSIATAMELGAALR